MILASIKCGIKYSIVVYCWLYEFRILMMNFCVVEYKKTYEFRFITILSLNL